MARPLRLEIPGALYHVTSRGDGRRDIYLDDSDRQVFYAVLGEVSRQCNWRVHADCQMTNHYHLLVETPEGNLSRETRQLNGVYTQRFNRRHGRSVTYFKDATRRSGSTGRPTCSSWRVTWS